MQRTGAIRLGSSGRHRSHDELLLGIERLRTRAAVSVASCRRITSPPLWHRYFELESRARRVLKSLRSSPGAALFPEARGEAIAALARPPAATDGLCRDTEARCLCEQLEEVLTLLESSPPSERRAAEASMTRHR